jgi:hypothetical protein
MYSTLFGLVLAPAAMAANSFSGYVTDEAGVEPIKDALVSVEWRLVPTGTASGRLVPTYLAVWQSRTDRDGGFRFVAPAEPLVLPSGTALARGAPQLRVFALGRETIQPPQLNLVYSIGNDLRINIVSWPEQIRIIRMQRIDDVALVRQVDGWYAEVHRALGYDVWTNGTKQARASYRPFLELISDACIALEYRINFKPSSCARARAEFNLPARMPQWVEFRPTVDEQPDIESANPRIVAGTQDEAGAISGRKQEPPKQ